MVCWVIWAQTENCCCCGKKGRHYPHTNTTRASGPGGSSLCWNLSYNRIWRLSDDEKAKVERVLFLQDKFCAGDAFYHVLTMVVDGLPKSYLVKQRREQLSSIYHVPHTPGSTEGAQLMFIDLLWERMKDHLASHPDDHGKPVKVKISGDGGRMTRDSSFTLLSFALLQAGDVLCQQKGITQSPLWRGKKTIKHYKYPLQMSSRTLIL